ncbi:hypothetical protein Pmani_014879 [Petrolisthes manimaculis]|uniref:Uncharacterized protein n=1 Tax=Petrolisthes manimaculis TaxID=1843537 RepID=A0AAE1PT18_9EUCA|nr:hypothetical protein Pmani_014879 [Petrolisthes manimaculis]
MLKGILCPPRERYTMDMRGMWPRGGGGALSSVWMAGCRGGKNIYREIGERRWKVKCEAEEEHIQAGGSEEMQEGIYRMMAEKEDDEEMGLRGGGKRR